MRLEHPPAQLAPGFWMLGLRAYPVYVCHDGEEAAIFEGGIGALVPIVARQLAELGIPNAAVRQILITHAHPDHVMGVPQLRARFPHAAVAGSAVAARTLANEKAIALFRQVDQVLAQVVASDGDEQTGGGPGGFEPGDKTIVLDRVLQEGDTVAVGGRRFQVLATPGHSDCSLSFFEAHSRVLVISDATGYYVPERGLWWPNYFGGYAAYVASIRRLAGLGASVLCLSHNAALVGAEEVQAYFDAALAATQAYHHRIIEAVRAGQPAGELAGQLGREAYDLAPVLPVEFFQKNCSLLVKQSLAAEGLAPEK